MAWTIGGHSYERRVAITIASDEVPGSVSGFVAIIRRSELPDEMFDSDGSYPTQSDGRDVRVCTNDDGTGQIAAFVDGWSIATDPATVTDAAIYCAYNPSPSSDSTLYVFYDSGTATMPAVDSTYGQEAVFDSSWHAYYTMSEDPSGTSPQVIDRTGNGYSLTSEGSMTFGDVVSGKVGKDIDLDGSDDGLVESSFVGASQATFTFLQWFKATALGSGASLFGTSTSVHDCTLQIGSTGGVWLYMGSISNYVGAGSLASTGTWYHLGISYDGDLSGNTNRAKLYVNNVQRTSNGGTIPATCNLNRLLVGKSTGATGFGRFNGIVSDIGVRNVATPADWLTAHYNMTSNPGTFFTTGTPESSGGGGSSLPLIHYYNRLLSN